MSELRDAMRMASQEPMGRTHPPDAKICPVCKGKGWLWIEFQSEFCNPHGMETRQTRSCKECNETGIMADARWAMLALQGKKKPDESDAPPQAGPIKIAFQGGRTHHITFQRTYVWTGLDWIDYENPFYVRSKREGRSE